MRNQSQSGTTELTDKRDVSINKLLNYARATTEFLTISKSQKVLLLNKEGPQRRSSVTR